MAENRKFVLSKISKAENPSNVLLQALRNSWGHYNEKNEIRGNRNGN